MAVILRDAVSIFSTTRLIKSSCRQ